MLLHSDRRWTLRWTKIGPPRGGWTERAGGSVAALAGATSPCGAPRLPTDPLRPIPAYPPQQDRL